jgi:hypothetical protein
MTGLGVNFTAEPDYVQNYLSAISNMSSAPPPAVTPPPETLTPSTKKARTHVNTSSSNVLTHYATPTYTGRFVLLEQPNVRQRKSYKNENRYAFVEL